ncbi:MAG: hypothetical protein HY002_16045 [Candidatus Rokubacteria bacterium]|nr:hypothetical protein [Candidatus Rokubacteria bacterium]
MTAAKVAGATGRTHVAGPIRWDAWWIEPAFIVLVLGSFIVYSTWAALQNGHYYVAPYLSPFYSPCLSTDCQHVTVPLFGRLPTLPIVGALSPAFLILWSPAVFRLTCYYYRKAYYRSFWGAPPACAVPDVRRGYAGETRLPLLLQNVHRYTFYLALVLVVILSYDVILAFRFPAGFGIGVGTLVMLVNVVLLACYTLSCHSCRHLCGGSLDAFSKAPGRYGIWYLVTQLNERHPVFAWLSLFSVGLTDLYIRLVSMGAVRDFSVVLFRISS